MESDVDARAARVMDGVPRAWGKHYVDFQQRSTRSGWAGEPLSATWC
jgi:hypothetical protein